ncbi:MAG: flagellar export protein FliJ [Treponema sp.]|jgi:flagellar FliJ protein|nr:flagellar export protein FliJ [Treponema sp.]
MKRFKFSLEKILELRKYRERETEIDLGRAVGVLTLIENDIASVAWETYRARENRYSTEYGIRELITYDLYITRLDMARERLQSEAAKAEQKVEEKRGIYLEASRDRKVIDKIREKRETEYRGAMLAEETKVLDDIANGARARKMVNEGRLIP